MLLSRRLLMAIPEGFEFKNFVLFTATGTFNVPAGVTSVKFLYSGGGGGGGKIKASFYQSRIGGEGGMGLQTATVTPGAAETITIGAGGTGVTYYNTGNGSSGGSTTAFGFTATGGQGGGSWTNGSDGTATSYVTFSRNDLAANDADIDASDANKTILGDFDAQSTTNPNQGSATVYSQGGSYKAGQGGTGGWARTSNDGAPISNTNGRGGIGGFVGIWY